MFRMKWLCTVVSVCALAAQVHFHQSGFEPGGGGLPEGWRTWSPRAEIAPRTFVDTVRYRKQPGSLAISGNSSPAVFGGWVRNIPGIEAGKWYRFSACYRAEGTIYEPLQMWARLDWTDAAGKRAGQPEYAWRVEVEGDWKRISIEAPAPERATAVNLELSLLNAPTATVYWDEIALDEIAAPRERRVRLAALNYMPRGTQAAAESVRQFLEKIDESIPGKADIILLPEGITVVGTGKKYADVAEPIPGPTTARLSEVAKRKQAYIAAGLYEREAQAIYNTAVLIDRGGKVAGKYRKVYIPREEMEGGITPGSDYPVFETDFGKVGLMICWDLQFADPARALALRGAEILLVPIWGGNPALGKARAIENQVFLVSSGYNYPTYVLDPTGEMLAQAAEQGRAAIAEIDLNRRYIDPWLGDMRARLRKELRLDLNVEPVVRQR